MDLIGQEKNQIQSCHADDFCEPALGELHITDRLYNALHGVGDLSPCEKTAVLITMHDHLYPGDKIVRDDDPRADERYLSGRDEIIRIVERCLATVPETVRPILQCWLLDVHEYFHALTGGIKEEG